MAPLDTLIASSELATRMLEDLPEILYEDPDVRGVIYAQARGIEMFDAATEEVRANLFPHTATETGLPWWEAMLGATINPLGLTVQQRRDVVVELYRLAGIEGTGLGWEQIVTRIVGTGWSYREHTTGFTSPPAWHLEITITFPANSAAFGQLRRALETITPANLVITLLTSVGFHLDVDHLDVEPL